MISTKLTLQNGTKSQILKCTFHLPSVLTSLPADCCMRRIGMRDPFLTFKDVPENGDFCVPLTLAANIILKSTLPGTKCSDLILFISKSVILVKVTSSRIFLSQICEKEVTDDNLNGCLLSSETVKENS